MSAPFCCFFWQIVTVLNNILQHTLAAKNTEKQSVAFTSKVF